MCGIEGILSRLESERSLAYGFGSVEKRVNGKASWRNEEHDGDDTGEFNAKFIISSSSCNLCVFCMIISRYSPLTSSCSCNLFVLDDCEIL